ncbi:MAG TPA: hypothetical protein PLO67_17575, partial [Saprospiraceae bacterium]|nr:hypothetical protein [Saprospiraceae bacterium]
DRPAGFPGAGPAGDTGADIFAGRIGTGVLVFVLNQVVLRLSHKYLNLIKGRLLFRFLCHKPIRFLKPYRFGD